MQCHAGFQFHMALPDIVSRHLNSHVETPAGVVVAPIGALVFIYLARREKLAG